MLTAHVFKVKSFTSSSVPNVDYSFNEIRGIYFVQLVILEPDKNLALANGADGRQHAYRR